MPLKYFELLWWKQFWQIYKVRETKPQQALIRIEFRNTSENKFSHLKKNLHISSYSILHICFCSSFCFSFEIVPSGIFYSQESWGLLQFCAHQSHSQLQTGFTKNILFPFSFFNQHIMSTKAKLRTSNTKRSLF